MFIKTVFISTAVRRSIFTIYDIENYEVR